MEQGTTVAVKFKGDSYLQFINFCFTNVLISGVDVNIIDAFAQEYVLFIRIASPGIDRIDRAILKFGGHTLTF